MINIPEHITLAQAIEFHSEFGQRILDRSAEVEAIQSELERELENQQFEIEQAYWMASFFSDKHADELMEEIPVHEILFLFRSRLQPMFIIEGKTFDKITWNDKEWFLPSPSLQPKSEMTFGEFIDAKVMVQDVVDSEGSKWEMLLYIAAIFLRQDNEAYDHSFLYDDSQRLELMRSLPLTHVAGVGKWFDEFNDYLIEYFPVFAESQLKSGAHIKLHMDQWGWINFLKSVAATKVFDIANSGLNSIDCARQAKAYDVLVSASEEKGYNEAVTLDMEAAYKKT